jgi:hypothetical protein
MAQASGETTAYFFFATFFAAFLAGAFFATFFAAAFFAGAFLATFFFATIFNSRCDGDLNVICQTNFCKLMTSGADRKMLLALN